MNTVIHGAEVYNDEWQYYFASIAELVSGRSVCNSRQVGAVLVRDRLILATGYNGPPRGFPHCDECPRLQKEDYEPGKYLEICPATHAEINCLASAARMGVSVKGATLFINTNIPCKNCMAALINAGVQQIFAEYDYYDTLAKDMVEQCGIRVFVREEED